MPAPNLPQGGRGYFVPTVDGSWNFFGGTWTKTRSAAGNYYMAMTPAAGTVQALVNLTQLANRIGTIASPNMPEGAETIGAAGMFTGFDLVYAVGTLAATSITPNIYEVAYANNAAAAINTPAIPAFALTPTVAPPAVSANLANPYVQTFALAGPYLLGKNLIDVNDWLEIVIVTPATTVLNMYGVQLRFNNP